MSGTGRCIDRTRIRARNSIDNNTLLWFVLYYCYFTTIRNLVSWGGRIVHQLRFFFLKFIFYFCFFIYLFLFFFSSLCLFIDTEEETRVTCLFVSLVGCRLLLTSLPPLLGLPSLSLSVCHSTCCVYFYLIAFFPTFINCFSTLYSVCHVRIRWKSTIIPCKLLEIVGNSKSPDLA